MQIDPRDACEVACQRYSSLLIFNQPITVTNDAICASATLVHHSLLCLLSPRPRSRFERTHVLLFRLNSRQYFSRMIWLWATILSFLFSQVSSKIPSNCAWSFLGYDVSLAALERFLPSSTLQPGGPIMTCTARKDGTSSFLTTVRS